MKHIVAAVSALTIILAVLAARTLREDFNGAEGYAAGASGARQKPENLMLNYFVRAANDLASRQRLPASREEWDRRRGELRNQLRETLGNFPWENRPPLDARITGKLDHGDHVVEKVLYESLPGLYVTALAYVPKNAQGRLPAVICVNGHWPDAKATELIQRRCMGLARMGVIAFCQDVIGTGERQAFAGSPPQYYHGFYRGATPRIVDRSLQGYVMFECIRALDYRHFATMSTRPGSCVPAPRVEECRACISPPSTNAWPARCPFVTSVPTKCTWAQLHASAKCQPGYSVIRINGRSWHFTRRGRCSALPRLGMCRCFSRRRCSRRSTRRAKFTSCTIVRPRHFGSSRQRARLQQGDARALVSACRKVFARPPGRKDIRARRPARGTGTGASSGASGKYRNNAVADVPSCGELVGQIEQPRDADQWQKAQARSTKPPA